MISGVKEEYVEKPQVTERQKKCGRKNEICKKIISKQERFSLKAKKLPHVTCKHSGNFCAAAELSKDDIKKFNAAFYKNRDVISQKTFLHHYIDVKTPSRNRPNQGKSQRSEKVKTIVYHVPIEAAGVVKVCRESFLSILNIGRRRVENAAKEKVEFGYAVPETRGGARTDNIVEMNKIMAHMKNLKYKKQDVNDFNCVIKNND